MLDECCRPAVGMVSNYCAPYRSEKVRKLGSTGEDLSMSALSKRHPPNLADCVSKGRFRQDLFYRLNVIDLSLPPLRSRQDDIGELAHAILLRLSHGKSPARLTPQALEALQAYPFPGNVRELENILSVRKLSLPTRVS